MADGRARCARLLALALVGIGGCATASTPNDAAPDSASDSAWCSAVTCARLSDLCHAGICDLTMPFPQCFDTTRGVCSTYACTIPCGHDAGHTGP